MHTTPGWAGRRRATAVVIAATVALAGTPAQADGHRDTETVSVSSAGLSGTGPSHLPSMSGNGRYVAFESYAADLVPGDVNGMWDVFLRDRVAGTTIRISETRDGTGGDYNSLSPAVSTDGRFVAFSSGASNLAGNRNGGVFIYEVATGDLELVSRARDGSPGVGSAPTISADGRHVAFTSRDALVPRDNNDEYDVYLRDRGAGTTRLVSISSRGRLSDGFSDHASISANGRFVAFESYSANLVPRDTGTWDVFVRDVRAKATEKVSVNRWGRRSPGASRGPWISGNGRFVAFSSGAPDLVARDTNRQVDIFLRDRRLDHTRRVSQRPRGLQSNSWSRGAVISRDGSTVAYLSGASNLAPRDTNEEPDIHIWTAATGRNRLAAVGSGGAPTNGRTETSALSRTGRFVAFSSEATNVALSGADPDYDVYWRDLG